MISILEDAKEQHDEYHEINRIVVSVYLFVLITMIDSMVAGKYFILADRDYDRRFMRGKLFVILNEGFKNSMALMINLTRIQNGTDFYP